MRERGNPLYEWSCRLFCFDRRTDRGIIGSMNQLQLEWGFERICSYIENGVLMSCEINKRPVSRRVNGKEEWFIPLSGLKRSLRRSFPPAHSITPPAACIRQSGDFSHSCG